MKRISVLGLGYIGLPTAILAAESGYNVFGFDTNKNKITSIINGDATIVEPEITERLSNAFKRKNFTVSATLEYADCFLVTVPTPLKKNKKADLQHVFQAGDQIAKRLMPGNLIIIESTVPVGTTEKFAQRIEEATGLRVGVDFFIAHCPERGLPGVLFKELIENDRVIGGICQKSCNLAYLFYSKFVKGFLYVTDDKSAELVKLIENSSRDVQIAFANQVASMCYRIGLDPYQVIELANKHPRVSILSPTCGVGGHCLAVDPQFLIEGFPQDTKLLKISREVNENKPYQVIEKLLAKINELNEFGTQKPRVLGLGLSFKPNVDDIRESPALLIAQELTSMKEKLDFVAYDPYVKQEKIKKLNISYAESFEKELAASDIILILVKHADFLALPENIFCNKIILDSCGLLYDIQKSHNKKMLGGATRSDCSFENISF